MNSINLLSMSTFYHYCFSKRAVEQINTYNLHSTHMLTHVNFGYNLKCIAEISILSFTYLLISLTRVQTDFFFPHIKCMYYEMYKLKGTF